MRSPDIVFKAIAHPARRKIISMLSEADHSVKEFDYGICDDAAGSFPAPARAEQVESCDIS